MSSSIETRRFSPFTVRDRGTAVDDRAAARSAGYAEGWATGRRDAQLRADAEARDAALMAAEREHARTTQVDRALRAVHAAASELESRLAPAADDVADLIVEAALALARTVLDAELSVVDGRAAAALRRALTGLPADGTVTVRLHPDDVSALDSVEDTGRVGDHAVELVADASLAPGDAVAEQGPAQVDARVAAGLQRAAAAMTQAVRA
jgi:flagellar assembly protein FliH